MISLAALVSAATAGAFESSAVPLRVVIVPKDTFRHRRHRRRQIARIFD